MDVILSIKPEYAQAIADGRKKYEFRRVIFKNEVERIFVYRTEDVKKIIGLFDIEKILFGSPIQIWNKCYQQGGIARKDFFQYYRGAKKAFAIKIGDFKEFKSPIEPREVLGNFYPPQSFQYVDGEQFSEYI